ncbi:hypothetical protein ACNKF0_09280 [Nocardioides sp. T5]|uniref:hypothetical protein n=1 Tax=Nocardioides sp. T5 TaxID=3400182 RepID=UPI003A84C5A0
MSNSLSTSAALQNRPARHDDVEQARLSGEDFLSLLAIDHRVAGRALVNAINGNQPIPDPQFGYDFDATMRAALAEATVPAPHETAVPNGGRLPGSITFNRTSTPATTNVHAAPTKADMAWVLAAERFSHDILKVGVPTTLTARAALFATLCEPIKTAFRRHGLDRRGAIVMEAATSYLIHHAQPTTLRFVTPGQLRRWTADQCDLHDETTHGWCDNDGLPAHAAARTATTRLTRRRRVLWAHPDGIGHGLMLDRFHHTHIPNLVPLDSWARRKVAEDLTSLADLLRHTAPAAGDVQLPTTDAWPAVLGVRVLSHRAPNTSVHFTATVENGRIRVGRHHRLGGCAVCTPQHLPANDGATPSTTPGPVLALATGARA